MTLSPSSVLVTGASGFLGAHVVRTLAARGLTVRAQGRESSRLQFAPEVQVVRADLTDLAALTDAAAGCDAIVHCAALSAPWGARADFEAANVTGTANVIAAAEAGRIGRLVHISSPAVLFTGSDQHEVGDDAPYPDRPSSEYARTKQRAEALVTAASSRMATVILRPKAIYGAGDRALVPRLLRAARDGRLPQIGDGRNAVDVTHVDDVVQAVECALSTEAGVGGCFLITGGEHVRLWEMIRALLHGVGLRYPSRQIPLPVALAAAAVMESVAAVTQREPTLTRYSARILALTQTYEISRARTVLGYMPRVSAADGVARTVDALRRDSVPA